MIRFHMLIPAEVPARTGQSLNVLLVTENVADEDLSVVIRIYGSLGKEWRELLAEERELPAHSHSHLYFNLPAERLSADFWGEEVEELSLAAGLRPPGPSEQGTLVFFE